MKVTMRSSGVPGIHVKPGTYPVTVVEPAPVPDVLTTAQYGTSNVIRFTFALDGMFNDDGEQMLIDAIANHNLSPLSKLNEWIQALGLHPAIGDEVDLDELVGCRALAQIIDNHGKDGQVYSRVDKIVAAPMTPQTKSPAPKVAKSEQIETMTMPWNGEVASVINPDGGCNWARFWMEAGKHGLNEQHVIAFAGDGYAAYDGADAQQMLESLIAKASA